MQNASALPEILATLERHPHDDKIAYVPDDPSIYVPLVRDGFLKAAIVPCKDGTTFKKEMKKTISTYFRTLAETSRETSILGVAWWSDGDFDTYYDRAGDNITPLTPEQWKQFPELFSSTARHLYTAYRAQHPDREIDATTVLMANAKSAEQTGLNPAFHQDQGLSIYMSLYGAKLQYIAGGLTAAEETQIGNLQEEFPSSIVKKMPQLKGRICELEHGDTLYFNDKFWHRSSHKIAHKGQLAFVMY